MRGAKVDNLAAWAFRVGVNAARKLARRSGKLRSGLSELELRITSLRGFEESEGISDVVTASSRSPAIGRQELRHVIAEKKEILTRKQFLVAMKLCEPDMSLHGAAKALGMDRSGLRALFQRALAALAKH